MARLFKVFTIDRHAIIMVGFLGFEPELLPLESQLQLQVIVGGDLVIFADKRTLILPVWRLTSIDLWIKKLGLRQAFGVGGNCTMAIV